MSAQKPLAEFGHHLGMAFQIADDLLDYNGSEAVTGKPTGHDLRERKVTLPLVGALRNMSEAESREIRDFFTLVVATDEGIDRIIDIVRDRGGLEYASERADSYAGRAWEALGDVPQDPAVEALKDAVAYVVGRDR